MSIFNFRLIINFYQIRKIFTLLLSLQYSLLSDVYDLSDLINVPLLSISVIFLMNLFLYYQMDDVTDSRLEIIYGDAIGFSLIYGYQVFY